MKKGFIIFSVIFISSFTVSAEQKKFIPRKEYKFTDGQAIMTHQLLNRAKQIVVEFRMQSDKLPAAEATMFINSADSIIRVIERQYVDTLK